MPFCIHETDDTVIFELFLACMPRVPLRRSTRDELWTKTIHLFWRLTSTGAAIIFPGHFPATKGIHSHMLPLVRRECWMCRPSLRRPGAVTLVLGLRGRPGRPAHAVVPAGRCGRLLLSGSWAAANDSEGCCWTCQWKPGDLVSGLSGRSADRRHAHMKETVRPVLAKIKYH
jgi:hypothetical protein